MQVQIKGTFTFTLAPYEKPIWDAQDDSDAARDAFSRLIARLLNSPMAQDSFEIESVEATETTPDEAN